MALPGEHAPAPRPPPPTRVGIVRDLKLDVTNQASVPLGGKLVSLFENNLVALRAEIVFGSAIGDVEAFAAYEGGDALDVVIGTPSVHFLAAVSVVRGRFGER